MTAKKRPVYLRLAWWAAAMAGLLCCGQSPATPVAAPGFSYVRSLGGIDEYRLDSNGLQVLLVSGHSVPVVCFNVTYRAGSRNEGAGSTGSMHLLEHMMGRGSAHYNSPAGNGVKEYQMKVGGQFNAQTLPDLTNYFAVVERDALEGYVAIDADRMRNLWLRESDRQAEMRVVRNEFERSQNKPQVLLVDEINAAAYQAFPYHHSELGWRSDIENVPIEKLREFYDTYYWPNNATVTVVGDGERAATLAMIRKYYGVYPKAPHSIPVVYTEEPEQTGPRRVVVKRPGGLGLVSIAHKIPNGLSSDQPAIAILDAILSAGKDSRLYRALVDKGLALSARAAGGMNHDMSLHSVTAELAPGAAHEQAEESLLEQIELIKTQGVSAEEVKRAQRQYRAERAYRLDGMYSVADELNNWIATGDWTQFIRFPDAVEKVLPADVQRVAKTYLNEDQSTTGWFVPVSKDR
jgi:zinc protease